jgi:16S rRNA (guanine966-N2)-methyltransferase
MRIIAGSRRGRRLVPWEEAGIRPMRDFVRSALFNILVDLVPDARFLDLFCGTGSVGLEALSRGAREAVFVDRSEAACGIVRRNLAELGFGQQAKVVTQDFADAIDGLARRGRCFDLVFVGPPYDRGLEARALGRLGDGRLLAPGAVVVPEVRKGTPVAERYGRLVRIDVRAYGDNVLVFYRLDEA